MLRIFLLATSLAGVASGAQAITVTAVDGNADGGASLVAALLGSSSGLTVTSTSFGGAAVQSGTFSDFDTIGLGSLDDGIAMSSGHVALVPETNADASWDHNSIFQPSPENLPGGLTDDAQLSAVLSDAGLTSSVNDVNFLEFTFTVDDPTQNSVSTEFVFGTEEYPNQSVTDIFAFFVDGVNYAEFADGSLINFDDNNAAFYNDNTGNDFAIEWDGLTDILEVTGLLDTSLTEHTIRIAIADTSDRIFDSGVYLQGLSAGTSTGGGGIDIPVADPIVDPVVPAVPLPASFGFLLAGLGLIGAVGRRKR